MKYLAIILFTFGWSVSSFANEPDTLKVDSLLQKIKIVFRTDRDSALTLCYETENLAKELLNRKWLFEVHYKTAIVYYKKSVFDSAVWYYNAALDDLNSTETQLDFKKKSHKLALTKLGLGLMLYYQGLYAEAIMADSVAKSIAYEIGDSSLVAMAMYRIGKIELQLGDFPKALENFEEALSMYEELKDTAKIGHMYGQISGVYDLTKDFEKAEFYLNKAFEISMAGTDLAMKSNALIDMGILYYRQKEYEKGINYLKRALDFQKLAQDGLAIGHINSNLGVFYQHYGKLDSALFYYLKALEIYKANNQRNSISKSYTNLSSLSNKMGDFTTARTYGEKSLAYAQEIQSLDREITADYNLYLSYKGLGDFEEAITYLHSYYSLNDSVYGIEKTKSIQELETKFQTEKKNQEIEFLNLENQKQETEINAKKLQRNLWGGISLLALIFAGFATYFFFDKKKQSEVLAAKNEVIEKALADKNILLREIHHRVKNNLQIISSLLNMQSRFLDDDRSKAIVEESQNRIRSMSLIHQKLYQENNLTGIATKSYFTELISSLCHSYGIDNNKSCSSVQIDSLLLDVDTAIPLGLILNEMISNAFKYGVSKEGGTFYFSFKEVNKTELHIVVKDNGPGIPKDFDIAKSKSFGMKLITSLSKKLKANLDFKNENGLEITMIIRNYKTV